MVAWWTSSGVVGDGRWLPVALPLARAALARRSSFQSGVWFWLAFPSVASAARLLLCLDVVTARANGAQVVWIARIAAIADRRDLVYRGCGSSAAGRFDLTLVAIAFEDL
jgi:hypothetical protein